MKYLLAGSMAILAMPVQAAVLDCAALATSHGAEPAGYAEHCLGVSAQTRLPLWQPDSILGLLSQGYAIQIAGIEGVVPQGLYGFTLNNFPAAQRIGTVQETAGVYGLDFNPAGTRLYAAQHLLGGAGNRLGTYNLGTGAFRAVSLIFGLEPRDQVTGLAIHPRTGEGWLSTINILTNNPQLSQARLWRVNTVNGSASLVGRLLPDDPNPVFIDIKMNCDGQLYAHNISDDSLYRINPTTAAATRIGTHGLPANFAQGMDFDNSSGQLYSWVYTGGGTNKFGTFNLQTGAFTELAANAPRGQWEGAIPDQCAPKPIDADAITGAWYAPYTNGQGFTARFFPESGQVFMPWFTYSQAGGSANDKQRWYALFGQIPANNTTVTELVMPIAQVLGGSFDQPPALSPVQVGTARLKFFSCFEGVLDYQFDPAHNGGAQGRISMTRLLPLGSACSEFDNTVIPAESAYNAAFTGSWYDPETAGQGLELFRVPGTDTNPGLLYGAWFTFDPAPSEPGPAGQRWLTLEGQIVQTDGSIKSNIVLTQGGSFDNEPSLPALRIGEATLRSLSCSVMQMNYDFDDIEAAGEYRPLTGEIVFQRLGNCTPTSN